MNRRRRWWVSWCAAFGLVVLSGRNVRTEESLGAARELYASAAYDEALVLLNRLKPAADASEEWRAISQYRAFCLLALGRASEAERDIEAVLVSQPSYQPSAEDASPRLRATFADVRRRLLPAIVRQRYGGAKAAFDRKDFAAAADAFENVLELLSDPDVAAAANQPPLADLRQLAVGFRELSATAAAPPPPPRPATPPEPVPEPPRSVMPPAPAAPRTFSVGDSNVVPPIVVRQTLPPFPLNVFTNAQGTVSLIVDESGNVESATMIESVNPMYDRQIVEAAKNWRYKPATLDGAPVKYRRNVQIKFAPNR